MNYIQRVIRSIFNWVAERKLRSATGVMISHLSRVAYSMITLKEGCQVIIRKDSLIEGALIFDRDNGQIEIGERVFFGGGSKVICAERVVIEDDVLIAWGCTILDHNSHSTLWEERANDVTDWLQGKKDWKYVVSKPVIIKAKSWIGFNVIILKGVTIGEGAVIGAGSVVIEDVAPYTVVAGNPAKLVRQLTEADH